MSTLTKMPRTMKKLELPRPLKSTSGSTSTVPTRNSMVDFKITTVDDLIVLTETVACELTQGNYDRCLQNNVSLMYQHLKMQGGQLEAAYKDLLDRYFVIFRNGSQDDNLDKKSRLHLLELIELRAKQWKETDHMSHYYKQRGTHAEPPLNSVNDSIINNENNIFPHIPISPMELPAPLLLGPGEIIKTSGKFNKPTKIPGKNYSKDEVVIRNADSGKVMGIKGRRVHMIEELSDTIISFQRVNPGAKERLVQITGPNEENVNHAKHLIGDTIRRNASPVRLEGTSGDLADSTSSLNSSASEENGRSTLLHNNSNSTRPLLHSYSTNDANLGEYRYTVTVGTHSIKITGDNLNVVNMAKLILDDYFENMNSLETPVNEFTDIFNYGPKTPMESVGSIFNSPEYSNDSDETFKANGLPSPTDDDVFIKVNSGERSQNKLCYTREMLMHYSTSPLSKQPPNIILPPEIMRKASLDFNGETQLQKQKEARVSLNSASEDAKNSAEPE